MTTPKLFLYKAAEANTAVILRRGDKRDSWEIIRWDLDTDTFTEGQWLMKKQMNGKYAAISPCGRFFAYHYEISGFVKGVQDYQCHSVVSSVPNFTALYFDDKTLGNWGILGFTEKGEIVSSGQMVKKGSVELPFAERGSSLAPSGYVSSAEWTDPRGRVITLDEGKLFADGTLLYDTTDHMFVPRSAF